MLNIKIDITPIITIDFLKKLGLNDEQALRIWKTFHNKVI